jgi:DHA1 family bicyclomycin/chloramphenicol resistance-like MFS transporter
MMAIMMSLVALTIDIMLPAFPQMSQDLQLENENQIQLIISMVFLGMAIGQIFYGPISDALGRKPAIFIGFWVFVLGSFLCLFTEDIYWMSAGRMLQGIGLSANRIVCVAIIRDQFKGEEMAKVMSLIMSFFIIVPALAPSLGDILLEIINWKGIFLLILIVASATTLWFYLRQKETLAETHRIPLSFRNSFKALKEIYAHKKSRYFTIISGFILGLFLGYLNSIQQIVDKVYHQEKYFAIWFGVFALFIGTASFLNRKLVTLFGMENLVKRALTLLAISSGIVALVIAFDPSLIIFPVFVFLVGWMLFLVGIIFGNTNAIILEPLGHIAGIATSVVGAFSTFISIPLGILVGQNFDNNILPMFLGIFVYSAISWIIYHLLVKKSTTALSI